MPSLKTFIDKVSHPELATSLLRYQNLELPDVVSTVDSKQLLEVVDTAISNAVPGTRGAIERLIERISKLTDEVGSAALEEATDDLALAELPSKHARAVYVFLNDRPAFRARPKIKLSDFSRL